MALSEAEVRKVAALSQLQLSDEEVQQFGGELAAIVAYVEQLSQVDVSGVTPVAQVTGLVNVTRGDQPGAMFTPQQALAGAPKASDNAFLVPKAVER